MSLHPVRTTANTAAEHVADHNLYRAEFDTPTHIHSGASVATVDDATTARTLVLTDAGKVVRMTHASASTATVPPNSAVAFEIGAIINIYSAGAGGCTPTAGVGVTIRNNATPLVQYGECSIRKDGTDEWVRLG